MRKHVLLFASIAASSSHAAVITWTNNTSGYWNTVANWSPNRVPTTNDIVLTTNSGTYTVTLNMEPTLAGIVLGSGVGTQAVATAGETLTLNGTGQVQTTGPVTPYGVWAGANQVGVAGALVWLGGTIDTPSRAHGDGRRATGDRWRGKPLANLARQLDELRDDLLSIAWPAGAGGSTL